MMVRTSAETEIREQIAQRCKITFAEFMELALYHPEDGFYAHRYPGRENLDYYTSPAAHPAFAALLSLQLWQMWQALGSPKKYFALDVGGGDGRLVSDMADYTPRISRAFSEAVRYLVIDRCVGAIESVPQSSYYQRLVTDKIPVKDLVGCIFSNELVDSFPVHRFQIQEGSVKEVYVTVEQGEFVEFLGDPSTDLLTKYLMEMPQRLPDGYRGEVNLRVQSWMDQVSKALKSGFVVTIDYGDLMDNLYSDIKGIGTLQTFYRHTDGDSPYKRIGRQDITSHVNFSDIISHGERVGLRPIGFFTQAEFLYSLGIRHWIQQLRRKKMTQSERDANALAMRDLIEPEGLGNFKVLVQEKCTPLTKLTEISQEQCSEMLTTKLPVPLLGSGHIDLFNGRYPHLNWRWQGQYGPSQIDAY